MKCLASYVKMGSSIPRNPILSGESRTLDAELSLPLIGKQGYLNGPQCERIMEQLEVLQDNERIASKHASRIKHLGCNLVESIKL